VGFFVHRLNRAAPKESNHFARPTNGIKLAPFFGAVATGNK
jgi:hypothetical protein